MLEAGWGAPALVPIIIRGVLGELELPPVWPMVLPLGE